MKVFLFQVLAGVLGVFLAAEIIPGIIFVGPRKILLLIGLTMGIINYFIKPIINFFLFPIRLLTFGLIGVVINIVIVWFTASVLFPSYLKISTIPALLGATTIIWAVNFFFYLIAKRSWSKQRCYD